MDFEKVLPLIIKDFKEAYIDYALIGGFAMGVLGVVRATVDIDFLVNLKDILKIKEILTKHKYKVVYESENVTQFISDNKLFGEIDFLHAFRDKAMKMIKRAKLYPIFKNKLNIRVIQPEDLIGLKVQAFMNDSSRKNRDLADIEMLMDYFNNKLNWNIIEDYFNIFNKNDLFYKLKKNYENPKKI